MLKLSDPVSPISPEFQVSKYSRVAIAEEFLRRARFDAMVDEAEDRREAARQFVSHAERLVDQIKAEADPEPVTGCIPRFVDVPPVRFGRVRLFLSKFIGRAAWRGWVGL